MDILTALVGLATLGATFMAVRSAIEAAKWKRERGEHADARARADAFINRGD